MDEEQVGTVEGSESAVSATGEDLEGQSVQPGDAESAESVQPETTTPNWDDPNNPYLKFRDQYTGLQGNFKQLKTQADESKRQLQSAQMQYRQMAEERQRVAQEYEEQRLRSLLDEPETLAEELRKRMDQQASETSWQQRTLPQLQHQISQQIYQNYNQAINRVAPKHGLSEDDLKEIATQHSASFDDFLDNVLERAKQKQTSDLEKLVEERVTQELKAREAQASAQGRAQQRSPNATTGQAPRGDDDASFLVRYAQGLENNHEKARKLLAALQ